MWLCPAAICQTLGIEHHCVDLCNDFQEKVIAPFVHKYDIGLTSNLYVICNSEIKFGVLAKCLLVKSLPQGIMYELE